MDIGHLAVEDDRNHSEQKGSDYTESAIVRRMKSGWHVLGIGIIMAGLAADGDEVVGAADDVLDPLLGKVGDPEDADEDGPGGAAIKISFCAPSANP